MKSKVLRIGGMIASILALVCFFAYMNQFATVKAECTGTGTSPSYQPVFDARPLTPEEIKYVQDSAPEDKSAVYQIEITIDTKEVDVLSCHYGDRISLTNPYKGITVRRWYYTISYNDSAGIRRDVKFSTLDQNVIIPVTGDAWIRGESELLEFPIDPDNPPEPTPSRTPLPDLIVMPEEVMARPSKPPVTSVPPTATAKSTSTPGVSATSVPSTKPTALPTETSTSEPQDTQAMPTKSPVTPGIPATPTKPPVTTGVPATPTKPPVTPGVPTTPSSPEPTIAAKGTVTSKVLPAPRLLKYARGSKKITLKGRIGTFVKIKIGKKHMTVRLSKRAKKTVILDKKLKKGTKIKLYAVKRGYRNSKIKVYRVR